MCRTPSSLDSFMSPLTLNISLAFVFNLHGPQSSRAGIWPVDTMFQDGEAAAVDRARVCHGNTLLNEWYSGKVTLPCIEGHDFAIETEHSGESVS
jgi:hypothetical protein